MKPLNWKEVALLSDEFQKIKEAILQNIISSEKDLILIFYKGKNSYYLWFDLSLSHPICSLFDRNPNLSHIFHKKTKPAELFLKSHFKNLKLKSIKVLRERERILFFEFKNSFSCEFRCFPKGSNFIVKKEDKNISWYKVKEEQSARSEMEFEARSIEDLKSQWLALRDVRKKKMPHEKIIEKNKKALNKIKETLLFYEKNPYKIILKIFEKENVKQEFENLEPQIKDLYKEVLKELEVSSEEEASRMKAQIADSLYTKSKDIKVKISRLEKRQNELEEELKKSPKKKISLKASKEEEVLSRTKTRRKEFSNSTCWVGRSGKDNLTLLRAAKPWYFWLHLRDYPGAHGIICRQKNQNLSSQELQEICEFFIKQNFGLRSSLKSSEKFDIMITEVRFVQPIKGDKLGRVRYQREKVMTIKISSDKINL